MAMKVLEVSVRQRDVAAAENCFQQNDLSFTCLPREAGQRVYRLLVPEHSVQSALRSMRRAVPSFSLRAVFAREEDEWQPSPRGAQHPFRALSESGAHIPVLALRLFGFKETTGK